MVEDSSGVKAAGVLAGREAKASCMNHNIFSSDSDSNQELVYFIPVRPGLHFRGIVALPSVYFPELQS